MVAITTTPPSAPAQMAVTLGVSDNVGGFGLVQSSSISDSNSTGQVGSTLKTVPVCGVFTTNRRLEYYLAT